MALKSISLAWNGLRWNGAASIARQVITNNAVMASIDISNNDIDSRAATQIAKVCATVRLFVYLCVFVYVRSRAYMIICVYVCGVTPLESQPQFL